MHWLLLLILFFPSLTLADNRPNYISVTWENDLFTLKDGGYTNGLGVFWAHGPFDHFSPENIPPWVYQLTKNLPISTMPGKQRAVSYAIGQAMQTPSDISQKAFIKGDFPYAGLDIWRMDLYAFDDYQVDKLGLVLGVIGPVSGAKAVQTFIHKATQSEKPEGWNNQLKNEIVFQITRERLWRLYKLDGKAASFDIIGISNAALGTLDSHIGAGFGFRLGRALDRSFTTTSAIPGREVNPLAGSSHNSWSLFINITASFVANSILIDGNTFQDSPSLPLKHWQANLSGGISFSLANWAFLLAMNTASDQFKGQEVRQRFGSFSLTYHFK